MRTRIRQRDDTGTTLLLVLIIITTIALVAGAVLSKAFSSVVTTLALRDQSGTAYAGDGAAQAAINQLRVGTFENAVGAKCFGTANTLTLPNFYPAVNGQVTGVASAPSSAAVVCAGEAGTGAQGSPAPITSANKPAYAVMTLGTVRSATQLGEGQNYATTAIKIRGGVISNADISAAGLTVTGGAGASARTTPCVTVTPACTAMTGNVADPNYPPPTDPPAPPVSVPACTNENVLAEFRPGLYTDSTLLNSCKASWMLFDPGTYYFDFNTGSDDWVTKGTVVGGTLTGTKSNTAPAVPGACVSPITTKSAVGVQFVFGGASRIRLDQGTNMEICASYHATTIPTTIYGLKSPIVNGAYTVHAESECILQVNGCQLISSDLGHSAVFYSQGFAYAPLASMNLQLNNTSGPVFNFGLVLRGLYMNVKPQLQGQTLISIPDDTPGYATPDTIVDLEVHVCPGASTCSASGKLQLRARVDITPVGGSRQVKILSWSEQR
jgi:hypothetical protein